MPFRSRGRMNPVTTREHICRKYDCGFNFYQAKSINQVVYNRRSEEVTLAAKDIAVLVEDTEYLKRYYSSKNAVGKDQISDRLLLLSNFYASADLLKYEYPMMVITHTEDIFTRRHKRITKINQEVGSSDSEQSSIEELRETLKDGSLLESLDWSDLVTEHAEIQAKPERKRRPSFQFEEYCIYGDELQKKTDDFLRKIGRLASDLSLDLILDSKVNAKQVNHLVLDFDDLDRQEVLNQFKKLADKENIPNRKSFISREEMRDSPFKLTGLIDKKPLSSSITISPLEPVASNETKRNPSNLNRQSMLLGSREQRDQQMKIMKKSSQIETEGRKKYAFPEEMIINQAEGDESPLLKEFTKRLHLNPIFQKEEYHQDKTKDEKHSPPFSFVKKADGIKNIYGRLLMKQSQIQQDGFLSKDRFRINSQTNKVNEELNKLKQKPIQFTQFPKANQMLGKDRIRQTKGLQGKEKQRGGFKDMGNPLSHGMNYGSTEARGIKMKEGEPRFRRVQSHDHFKFSPDRGWYEDLKSK